MSLETVEEDIREKARARAEEIRAEAEEEAEEILAEAEADADSIREERAAEVEREIEQERERKLSSAKLEAKQERLEARRSALESVRSSVEDAIRDLDRATREELTRELLEAADAEFDDDATKSVYGRDEDADLIEDVLADYENYEFAGTTDCLGGVVVESDASRVRVTNTFDSVLDSVWEDELRAISDRLFEEQ